MPQHTATKFERACAILNGTALGQANSCVGVPHASSVMRELEFLQRAVLVNLQVFSSQKGNSQTRGQHVDQTMLQDLLVYSATPKVHNIRKELNEFGSPFTFMRIQVVQKGVTFSTNGFCRSIPWPTGSCARKNGAPPQEEGLARATQSRDVSLIQRGSDRHYPCRNEAESPTKHEGDARYRLD
jgi:hypothetical protein